MNIPERIPLTHLVSDAVISVSILRKFVSYLQAV